MFPAVLQRVLTAAALAPEGGEFLRRNFAAPPTLQESFGGFSAGAYDRSE